MALQNKKTLEVIKIPLKYQVALDLMDSEKNLILEGKSSGKILLLEQEAFYTSGLTSYAENLLTYGSSIGGIPLIPSNRGGKITYHGPGQRVIYFILKLVEIVGSLDLRAFIEKLEKIVIMTLKAFGIEAQGDRNYPGVWIQNHGRLDKIAALGLKVSRGITSHGLAINVNNSLEPFTLIEPCGIHPSFRGVTSLSQILGETISLQEFDKILIQSIKSILTFHEICEE